MFLNCSNLSSLDLSSFETSNVTNMSSLFWGCSKLTNLDLSNFDTANVIDMSCMFGNCTNLTNLNVTGFNTDKVQTMAYMFYNCSNLIDLDISSFTAGYLRNTDYMFSACGRITNLDLSHFETDLHNMYGMFENCSSLTSLDLHGFRTSEVAYMSFVFEGCSSLKSLDLSNFDTGNVLSMEFMFAGCKNLTNLDLGSFNTAKVTDMFGMFSDCFDLESINLKSFNTENVTNFSGLFDGCIKLKNLDVSNFNTGNVTNMSDMFRDCRELRKLDLTSFDTRNTETMYGMFYRCSNLESLDVSSFDTGKVSTMNYMFFDCSSLSDLNIRNFNMHNVTDMSGMFSGCSSLSSVTLGSQFTVWTDDAYLPTGTWTNQKTGKSLSEKELYNQYPSNAAAWAGTWKGKLKNIQVTELWLKIPAYSINAGNKMIFSAVLYPINATNKKVKWSSSKPAVASIDKYGIVYARKAGKTVINIISEDGSYKGNCEIRVLFTDIPETGKYYSSAVYWAVDKGITNGYTDSDGIARTFKPQNNCTREAVVTFLWRLAGKPEPKNLESPFSDITDPSAYYYKAVLWAAEKGITGGYSDGTFRPSDTCLREHVVTFLYRYAGKPKVNTANTFTDVDEDDYYYKAVLWAADKGITKGYADDNYKTFRPKLDCLREHVVTFLYRYAKLK